MTVVASIDLAEAPARALAEAIDRDETLGALSLDLMETGPGDWRLTIYFESGPDGAESAALDRLAGKGRFTIDTLPETDWVAKSLEGLAPVRAGRFLVHGQHDRAAVRPNDIAIEIEAGLAFGTGHHGTTAGCLLAIEQVARRRPIVNALDLGTGSGVLAIGIAKRTHATVTASDIDPVAVRVAAANVRLNGVAGRVHTLTAAGLTNREIETNAPYDLIVANILAGPLVTLAPAICRVLAPGGDVILSGLLTDQRRRVAAAYYAQGLSFTRAGAIADWVTLTLTRRHRARARRAPR
jgi:ribosomal protein L11 methyltransferase